MWYVVDMGEYRPSEPGISYWPVRAYQFYVEAPAKAFQKTLEEEGRKTCLLEPADIFVQGQGMF